jgi:hypothetical protein
MRLGPNDDTRVAGVQAVTYEFGDGIEQKKLVVVELRKMAAIQLAGFGSGRQRAEVSACVNLSTGRSSPIVSLIVVPAAI